MPTRPPVKVEAGPQLGTLVRPVVWPEYVTLMLPMVPVAEPGLPEVAEDQLVHAIVSACARADVETAHAAKRSADTGFTSKRFSCIVVLL